MCNFLEKKVLTIVIALDAMPYLSTCDVLLVVHVHIMIMACYLDLLLRLMQLSSVGSAERYS